MSGFMLEPVDGGRCLALPEGETLLGRGPFLGISDKRVSRRHGLLKTQDGHLHIKPIHLNPCFRQASLEDAPQPLEKDCWHDLSPGDFFSLMPGKYIYRVLSTDQDNTQRNSQLSEEEGPIQGSPHRNGQSDPVTPEDLEQGTISPPANFGEEEHSTNLQQAGAEDSGSEIEARPKPEERKRMLPAWMLKAAGQTLPTPKGERKSVQARAIPSQARVPLPSQAASRMVSSGDSEHSDTEQTHRKRAKRKRSEEEQGTLPKAGVLSVTTTRRLARRIEDESSGESDGADRERGLGEEKRTTGVASRATPRKRSRLESMEGEEQEEGQVRRTCGEAARGRAEAPLGASTSTAPSRTPCPYGKDCYRKNPVHFKECSHPGDSDYKEPVSDEEDDGDDSRPECPYGTSCYRKNPQHKKEYRHTKDPGKRAHTQKRYTPEDSEDSFIDDESSDIDEDSDYVPPESDDSMDVRRQKALLRK